MALRSYPRYFLFPPLFATAGAESVRIIDLSLKGARLELNAMTRDQVREMIGPPYRSTRAALKPLEVWEYPWLDITDKRILWVSFSDDGVAREIIEMRDFSAEPSGRARRR